jgi:hypothetical protein
MSVAAPAPTRAELRQERHIGVNARVCRSYGAKKNVGEPTGATDMTLLTELGHPGVV